ncbi:MAG: hypothetical protein U1F46_15495 [Marinagarivorans sp.]
MIQFYLSKDAAADLKHLVESPSPENYQAMQWYVHRVTIARRKCMIAMEKQSRYAITFCGLTKKEFADFPQLFSYWFSLHGLASVVEQYGQDDVLEQRVLELAQVIADGQTYQQGFDRSVMAHINQVVDLLRFFVEERGYPLPVEPREAAIFASEANEQLKNVKSQDYFVPAREFRGFWMGLLNLKIPAQASFKPAKNNEPNYTDNVIRVDFGKKQHKK